MCNFRYHRHAHWTPDRVLTTVRIYLMPRYTIVLEQLGLTICPIANVEHRGRWKTPRQSI
jgi:hypothetical protein